MRIAITVEGGDPGSMHELRRWLSAEPELRGRIRGHTPKPLPPDARGLEAEALLAVLAPGGVAGAFAGALVAWARTRRGDQTVTVTRPDGTAVTVSTAHVKGLTAEQNAQLARELAAVLVPAAGPARPRPAAGEPPARSPRPVGRRDQSRSREAGAPTQPGTGG
ncbi:effector-associated constant component EACC1 [Streptomyces sp. PTD5-9]|uniref:effector-associated constant component EACC1 n=1 Tax=Streptomyces sp. PTD5-9 TaxID=3120150 RepID=UPI00300A35A0